MAFTSSRGASRGCCHAAASLRPRRLFFGVVAGKGGRRLSFPFYCPQEKGARRNREKEQSSARAHASKPLRAAAYRDATGVRGSARYRRSPSLPIAQDGNAVGHVGDDSQIMRDQQQSHAVFMTRSRSNSRICFCRTTSSAVVGSSAISSFGRSAQAMAIITRWRCPPDNSCG